MYKLRIVFTGLVCLHHDKDSQTFWALFFQPQSRVLEEEDTGIVLHDVPPHVTRIFGPGVVGPLQEDVGEGSAFAGFVDQPYLQLDDQHLTLAAQTKEENIELYSGDDDDGMRKYSWVASIPEVLKTYMGVDSSLKSELKRKPYRGTDLIARLELKKGIVRTEQLWGKNPADPSLFYFGDDPQKSSPLARKVSVELNVEGEATLIAEDLNGENGHGKKKLVSFRDKDGPLIEVNFVTAPSRPKKTLDANHFRGYYKLFDGLQNVNEILPAPYTGNQGTDGDGACSPGKSG